MKNSMNDGELFKAFEAGTLDPRSFDHQMHLRVGWLYVCRYPLAAAVLNFASNLKSWTQAIGAEGKYHETITWFFMLIINERQGVTRAETFDDFIKENIDLLAKNPPILDRYYSRELLASEHARNHYVLPDRLERRSVA